MTNDAVESYLHSLEIDLCSRDLGDGQPSTKFYGEMLSNVFMLPELPFGLLVMAVDLSRCKVRSTLRLYRSARVHPSETKAASYAAQVRGGASEAKVLRTAAGCNTACASHVDDARRSGGRPCHCEQRRLCGDETRQTSRRMPIHVTPPGRLPSDSRYSWLIYIIPRYAHSKPRLE